MSCIVRIDGVKRVWSVFPFEPEGVGQGGARSCDVQNDVLGA